MYLVFSNGVWKPMPHDNFMLNVAHKNKQLIRPIEAQLREGKVVKVGGFTFKETKGAQSTHIRP